MSSQLLKSIQHLVLALTMALCFVSTAEARNCKKGKPCGNSCIAKNDVCHKTETSSMSEAPASAPAAAAPAPMTAAEPSVKVKNCKKGKACGNSCIPKDAVCSIH
jgi:hypothetical protein